MVLLAEARQANARVVSLFDPGKRGLAASVMRRPVIGGRRREVLGVAFERGAIEMIERRNREHESRVEGAHPGKRDEGVAFAVGITQMLTGAVPRIVRIEGNLIKVATKRGDKAQLVRRAGVVNERSESAEAIGPVVDDGRGRSFEAKIGAVAVEAAVVGQALGVTAKIKLVIGLEKIADAGDEFSVTVAFESCARGYVEDAISAVAEIGGITSPLHLDSVNVFWINLRAEIAGDIGVGDRHAVDKPAHLVAAANVELIMSEVGAWDIVRNHGQAVGA